MLRLHGLLSPLYPRMAIVGFRRHLSFVGRGILCLVILGGLCLTFLFAHTPQAHAATIVTYANIPGDALSSTFSVQAESMNIFVGSFQTIDYARFASDGAFTLKITASQSISSYQIAPTTFNVRSGTVSGNMLTVAIPAVPYHGIVRISGLRPLAIFADPLESSPPQIGNSNVVNVMNFVTDNTGATDQHDNIINAINYVTSTSGKDTLYFPDGTYLTAPIDIESKSNLKIYLHDGALIKRNLNGNGGETSAATLELGSCTSCELFGRGVVDSQGKEYHDATGQYHQYYSIGIDNSNSITVQDIINRNSSLWNFSNHNVSFSAYYNVKDISTTAGSPENTDGFSVHNSHDITADYIFAMGTDDSLVLNSDNASEPEYNIEVSHFAADTLRARSIKIGYHALAGNYMSTVTVQDSDWYLESGCLQALQIEDGPSYYQDLRFRNLSFENNNPNQDYISSYDVDTGTYRNLSVRGDLEFTNLTFQNNANAKLLGDPTNKINNLIVHNLNVGGRVRTSLSDANLAVTNYNSLDFSTGSGLVDAKGFNRISGYWWSLSYVYGSTLSKMATDANGAYVEYDVNIAQAGAYIMSVAVTNNSNHTSPQVVSVNGSQVNSTVTNNGTGITTLIFPVTFNSGTNTIRVQSTGPWTDFNSISWWPANGGSDLTSGSSYAFSNQGVGKCLDNEGSTSNNTGIWIWDCQSGNPNQAWTTNSIGNGFYQLVNKASGKCLDNTGGSSANGNKLQQYDCQTNNQNQAWSFTSVANGYYQITNQGNGKCVDNTGNNSNNGNVTQIWDCLGNQNQAWSTIPR